ncbi:hypothetical protein D1007_30620 [Hordeum vulgare]|nr:hypothetical protein D1007_30620 [Hordeum vulgare]
MARSVMGRPNPRHHGGETSDGALDPKMGGTRAVGVASRRWDDRGRPDGGRPILGRRGGTCPWPAMKSGMVGAHGRVGVLQPCKHAWGGWRPGSTAFGALGGGSLPGSISGQQASRRSLGRGLWIRPPWHRELVPAIGFGSWGGWVRRGEEEGRV